LPRYYQYDGTECRGDWENNQPLATNPHRLQPFRFFAELARDVDFPIYSLLEDFATSTLKRHCLWNDPHWTLRGPRVAADAVMRRIGPHVESLLADR
jgi:hypothetical protein